MLRVCGYYTREEGLLWRLRFEVKTTHKTKQSGALAAVSGSIWRKVIYKCEYRLRAGTY